MVDVTFYWDLYPSSVFSGGGLVPVIIIYPLSNGLHIVYVMFHWFFPLLFCVLFACVCTQKTIASPGRGILAMDESNATCGKRLSSIGLENTEANRQAYRTLLVLAPGLGQYISGAILFEETLYQSTVDGKKIIDVLTGQNIVPGIKVDKVSCLEKWTTFYFNDEAIFWYMTEQMFQFENFC